MTATVNVLVGPPDFVLFGDLREFHPALVTASRADAQALHDATGRPCAAIFSPQRYRYVSTFFRQNRPLICARVNEEEDVAGALVSSPEGEVIFPPPEFNDWTSACATDREAVSKLVNAKLSARHSPATGKALPGPEPLPSFPGVLPFDYSYLPDCLRGYVQDISERMQCPPDFAAVGALVMVASIIGRKVGIRPMRHNDWTVIVNLWGAAVGSSGLMKSPALNEILAPLKQLQARAYEEFNAGMAGHEAKAELTKIQRAVKKTQARQLVEESSTDKALEILKPVEIDGEPTLKRYVTNNATYEALGEILMENPNGILVEGDELIGLLKQLDASGQEVARSFYLTCADGDKPYTFDRIMRGKGLHIPAACLSIIGGIQPGPLAEYVRQAMDGGAGADGLLQRFGLMVFPDISPHWREVDRYPDSEARQGVRMLVERLDRLSHIEIGAQTDPYGGIPFLRFDEGAQVLFSQWRATLEHRLRSGEEHPAIVSHLAKYRKLVPSLALINHLCDSPKPLVGESALLRAVAFAEYLESHARRIYSYATRPDIDAAKTLLKRLSSGKLADVFTAREVSKKGWAGLESPAKAQAAISLLADFGHLVTEEVATGGRPTTYYHWIKPRQHEHIP
ncbi:MAG: YfjI family protein [Burkholderiales bacterium]